MVVFNGEILNYKELGEELQEGISSSGDTAVLLEGLHRYGIDFLTRVRGQFAFAFYDSERDLVLLARDAVGILPLYYAVADQRLIFASEVAALPVGEDESVCADPESFGEFFHSRAVAPPRTLYAGVRSVAPGTYVSWSPTGGVGEGRWHSWGVTPLAGVRTPAKREIEESTLRLLRGSIARNLVSDVPMGFLLSGGLDSSLVAAIARELSPDAKFHAYVASFEGGDDSDEYYAELVAERLNLPLTHIHLRAEDLRREWGRLTSLRGAPLSEPADFAVHRIASQARADGVKVLLSGEGADEVFGGYPKYRFARLGAMLSLLPPLGPGGRAWVPRLPWRLRRLSVAMRALSSGGQSEQLRAWLSPFDSTLATQLGGTHTGSSVNERWGCWKADAVGVMSRWDIENYLPNNLLERADRMCMGASVEMRPPYLDVDLVEYALALPGRNKVNARGGKLPLRAISAEYLPKSVIARRKQGFLVPLASWFRNELCDFVDTLLLADGSYVASRLGRRYMSELLSGHKRGVNDLSSELFALVSFELWLNGVGGSGHDGNVKLG
jgi:asparagine synthase (glutamine-hydrolysing)